MVTTPPRGSMGKKIWYRDPIILGVAGIGGVAGLYVLAKNRSKDGGGNNAAEMSGAIPGAPYSSLGTDFYNAIEDSTSALQDKLSGLEQSVQDVNLRISNFPVTSTAPITAQPRPTYQLRTPGSHIRLQQTYTVQQLAYQSLGSGANTRAVSSWINQFFTINPTIAKKVNRKSTGLLRPGYIVTIPR